MICIWICHFWSDRFLPVISSILELLNDNSCIERSNKVKMWTCHLWIRTRLTAAFWGHFFPPEMINLALSRWVNVSVNSCHLWNPCGGSDGNMAGRRPPHSPTRHSSPFHTRHWIQENFWALLKIQKGCTNLPSKSWFVVGIIRNSAAPHLLLPQLFWFLGFQSESGWQFWFQITCWPRHFPPALASRGVYIL